VRCHVTAHVTSATTVQLYKHLLSSKIFDRSRHNFFALYGFSDGAQFATAKRPLDIETIISMVLNSSRSIN